MSQSVGSSSNTGIFEIQENRPCSGMKCYMYDESKMKLDTCYIFQIESEDLGCRFNAFITMLRYFFFNPNSKSGWLYRETELSLGDVHKVIQYEVPIWAKEGSLKLASGFGLTPKSAIHCESIMTNQGAKIDKNIPALGLSSDYENAIALNCDDTKIVIQSIDATNAGKGSELLKEIKKAGDFFNSVLQMLCKSN